MSIDDATVDELLARVRREVDEGLLPSVQIALAHEGVGFVVTHNGKRALDVEAERGGISFPNMLPDPTAIPIPTSSITPRIVYRKYLGSKK